MDLPRTAVQVVRERVQERGETPAFIFRTRDHRRHELTWSRLYRLSGRFAAGLRDAGLGRGHLVVNTLVNSPERVVCEVGLWMSGAASVNGHCQLADGSDLLHIMRVSRASALLVDPDVSNSPWHVLKNHISLGPDNNVTSSELKDLKKLIFIRRVDGDRREDFFTNLEAQKDWFEADDITPDDVLAVFTTSGTTGFPKLVVYSHGDVMKHTTQASDMFGMKSTMVIFNMAPLGWLGGYVSMCFVFIYVNCDVRGRGIPEDVPEFIWKSIQDEECDMAVFSPSYISRVAEMAKSSRKISGPLNVEQGLPAKQIKRVLMAGLPINRSMMEAGLTFADSVSVPYGSTDYGYMTNLVVKDSNSYVDHDSGLPAAGVTVKIVSPNDENLTLGVNQIGYILVKGPKRNLGYLEEINSPVKHAFTQDGFFRTQDIGRLDERGHLIVDGRGSDAIMRGSSIFYPSWIESRIRACPGVGGVIVTGIPDPEMNEELCACVVLISGLVTLEQVRQFVEKDVVAPEEDPLSPRPRYYLEFESFPLTGTDKPSRVIVKKLAAERLGLGEASL